jgi:hypothetical protein
LSNSSSLSSTSTGAKQANAPAHADKKTPSLGSRHSTRQRTVTPLLPPAKNSKARPHGIATPQLPPALPLQASALGKAPPCSRRHKKKARLPTLQRPCSADSSTPRLGSRQNTPLLPPAQKQKGSAPGIATPLPAATSTPRLGSRQSTRQRPSTPLLTPAQKQKGSAHSVATPQLRRHFHGRVRGNVPPRPCSRRHKTSKLSKQSKQSKKSAAHACALHASSRL